MTAAFIIFLDHCDFASVSCTSGTDEAAIIEVLSIRTSEQRQQIKQKYKTKYGKVCGVEPVQPPLHTPRGTAWLELEYSLRKMHLELLIG